MLSWGRATRDTTNVYFSLPQTGTLGVSLPLSNSPLPTISFEDNHTPVMVCCPLPNLPDCIKYLGSVIIYSITCGSKEP